METEQPQKIFQDLWSFASPYPPEQDLVLCVEVGLSRNIRDRLFPSTQNLAQAMEVLAETQLAMSSFHATRAWNFASYQIAQKPASLALALELGRIPQVPKEHQIAYLGHKADQAIFVNAEDHFLFTGKAAGLDFHMAEARALEWERAFEDRFPFAAAVDLGYLTTRLASAGPGMSARALLHLPALSRKLGKDLDSWLSGREELKRWSFEQLLISGEAVSGLYWIGGRARLGEPEEEFLEKLASSLYPVIMEERSARESERDADPWAYDDAVWRAWGLFNNHRTLSLQEGLQLWSLVRGACSMGILPADLSKLSGIPFRLGPLACSYYLEHLAPELLPTAGKEKPSPSGYEMTILDAARSLIVRRDLSGGE